MLISESVFIILAIIACLVVVAVISTLLKIIFTFGKNFKQSLMTVPAYLGERFRTFWSDGFIMGVFRSIFFIFILIAIPLIFAFNVIEYVPTAYFVSYDGNRFDYKTYVAFGRMDYADSIIIVNKDKVYIFNETDKTLVLHDVEYSRSGGVKEKVCEYSISPNSYLETNYKPDYWFGVPNQISIKINFFESPTDSVRKWVIESGDEWFHKKYYGTPSLP